LFRIDDFKAVVSPREFMRNNKFRARIAYPAGLTDSASTNVIRNIEFYCEHVRLPGVAIKTHNVARYGYGPTEQRPGMAQFVDVNMTFLSDGDGENIAFFRRWMNVIHPFDFRNGMQGNVYTTKYRAQYATQVWLDSFNEQTLLTSSIVLREAFPVSLDNIDMNWMDTNNLQKFTVVMAYNDWFEETNPAPALSPGADAPGSGTGAGGPGIPSIGTIELAPEDPRNRRN
jgi:hypothetical protein